MPNLSHVCEGGQLLRNVGRHVYPSVVVELQLARELQLLSVPHWYESGGVVHGVP